MRFGYKNPDINLVFISSFQLTKFSGLLRFSFLDRDTFDLSTEWSPLDMIFCILGSYAHDDMKRMNKCIQNEISFFKCFIQIWKSYVNEKIEMIERMRMLLGETLSSKNTLEKAMLNGSQNKIKESKKRYEKNEKYLENAIKIAESEVKRFQKDRLLDTKSYMISFVQRQIKISRETEYLISGSILRINLINFDCHEKKVRASNMNPKSPETSISKEQSFSWSSSLNERI